MPPLFGEKNHAYKHGHTRSRGGKWSSMYIRFMNIKSRCLRECDPDYSRYGKRGITVCERWLKGENGLSGFECFMEDMGEPPFDGATIDRINTLSGYSPDNCRWASKKEQANNRRTNRFIEVDGERKTVSQWSEISGVGPKTIIYRLNRGMSPKEAVFEVPSKRNRFIKLGENNG